MKLLAFVWLSLAGPLALAVAPDDLLDPEKAFRISAHALDERHVEVEFKIAPGYYMYRDRFSFATESGRPLGEVEIPRGVPKEDQFFGSTETFRDVVRIRVPVSPEDRAEGRLNLKVTSQGCSDLGVCYTPLEQVVRISLPGASSAVPSAVPVSLPSSLPWFLLTGCLAAGLAFGWVAAGAPLAQGGAGRLALPAVALFSAATSGLGALAGWLGAAMEWPWIGAPVALAYVVMAALWMHWSVHAGGLSRPVCGARDAALVVAALLLAFVAGNPWLGAALGMGTGLAAGIFRKARDDGRHAPALQVVGLAMLAAAAWTAAPVLPALFRMMAWGAWLVLAGTMLRALDPLPERAAWYARLGKAAGLALLVWGIAVLVGAMGGASEPLRPFAPWQGGAAEREPGSPIEFRQVRSVQEIDSLVASAGRPVMLDFYADWCVSCKEMEQFTFSDPQVRARMAKMLLLQADVTDNTAKDKAMLARFRLFGPPGIVFFDAQGRETAERVVGYQPPERFLRVLDAVLGEATTGLSPDQSRPLLQRAAAKR